MTVRAVLPNKSCSSRVNVCSSSFLLYVKAEKNAIIEELALEYDSKKKASSELWSSKLTFVVCRLSESILGLKYIVPFNHIRGEHNGIGAVCSVATSTGSLLYIYRFCSYVCLGWDIQKESRCLYASLRSETKIWTRSGNSCGRVVASGSSISSQIPNVKQGFKVQMTLEQACPMEYQGAQCAIKESSHANRLSKADGCSTTNTSHRAGKRGPATAYCAAIAFIKANFPADQWLCTERAA